MFTGIVETVGSVLLVKQSGNNKSFWIQSPLSETFKIDQSVSHNGVCLTIEAIEGDKHKVTAVLETLNKTNLDTWKAGMPVNIERCLPMNGRLDGHIVQGHVDSTAVCTKITNEAGSYNYTFKIDESFAHLIIEKGSISMNGTSLTIFNVTKNSFTVTIIPYTFENTSIRNLNEGDIVNIEFDILGKYIARWKELELK